MGPRPAHDVVQAIAGVARVLTVSSSSKNDAATLRDALAVLLPLDLVTETEDPISTGWEKTRGELLNEHPEELKTILAAASQGKEAVTEAVRDVLAEPIEDLEAENLERGTGK
jgi:hypothetical protein